MPAAEQHITHWYRPPTAEAPDSPVDLYVGPLEVGLGSHIYTMDGFVSLEWAPTPHVVWHVSSGLHDATHAALEDIMANLDGPTPAQPPAGAIVPPAPPPNWHRGATDANRFSMSGFIGNPPIGAGTALKWVTFFAANNLTPVIGHLPIHDEEYEWPGRMALTGGGWSVDLDTRRDRDQIKQWLQEHGGYTVTHVGRLRRTDGSDFTPQQALDALTLLATSLSFGAGRHVAVLLPVGYDVAGSAVWSDWRMGLLDPWSGAQHLADLHYPNHWHELFECFAAIWDDKFRSEEVLYRAFRLYLDANHGTALQLSVSTAQAGLDLLSYTHLVEDHGFLTEVEYRRPPAHQKLSDYLTRLHIDDSIDPTETPGLAAAAVRQQCATAPEMTTMMRNGVVHPSRSKPKFSSAEWFEARQLSLRYLILGILGYVSYQGTYRDPLDKGKWMGTVAKVPWNP